MAPVKIVDMREEFRHAGRAVPISETLRAAIAARLAEGTQALILINRRGYSWFLICRSCGASVQCENCSIALTYHKGRDRLVCHYCGYSIRVPKSCPKCQSQYVYFFGDGAERVEEYLREHFPKARIGRLDRDTVRTKREFQQVLGAFASGQLDILVGTQMVAKGHDFQRVTLVGVVAADLALSRPDFRAAERTFQLLTQVAGRAGRGTLAGEVFVETYYSRSLCDSACRAPGLSGIFREGTLLPPDDALSAVHGAGQCTGARQEDRKCDSLVARAAWIFCAARRKGLKVLGPAAAPLSRLRREYRFQFLLKTPKRSLLTQTLTACMEFCTEKEIPESAVLVDVDPTSLF